MEEQQQTPQGEYKPNIYPIMYWALAYGVLAGVILFVVFLLSNIITIVWFPVFLAGLIWGAFRNYKKQKQEWYASQGSAVPSKTAVDEFKDAFSDITTAGREMVAEQAAEDAAAEAAVAEEEAAATKIPLEEPPEQSEIPTQEQPAAPKPPQNQTPPPAPPEPPQQRVS